jgi:hypothetical protein
MRKNAKIAPINSTLEPPIVNPDASCEEITDNITKSLINPIIEQINDTSQKQIVSIKRKPGRPRVNTDVSALRRKIDGYFKETPKEELTMCGLALACGYVQRSSLWDGMDRNDIFSPIIKKAYLMIEESYERYMRKQNCTGSIFVLKNMGWIDKLDTGGGVFINIVPK